MERSNSKDSDASFSGNARFDASQYTFFGQNTAEEVELGGIEEEGDGQNGGDEYHLFDKDEVASVGSLLDVDDMNTTFLKRFRQNPPVLKDSGRPAWVLLHLRWVNNIKTTTGEPRRQRIVRIQEVQIYKVVPAIKPLNSGPVKISL